MLTPRPRQLKAINDSRAALIERKRRAIIVCAATGFGKTGVAAGIIQSALLKGNRVLFLADRRALVRQGQERLAEFGITSGIVMADHPESPHEQVQIASVQTLVNRLPDWAFKPQIVIVDEAHRSRAPQFKSLIDHYNTITIGLTATPCGSNGAGLGKEYGGSFEEIIPTASVRELIDDGTLCPFTYYLPELFDTSGISIRDGEYDEKQVQARLDDKPGIVGDFARYWLENCKGRPTLTFAPSIKEAARICDTANALGIRAVTIDTTNEEHEDAAAIAGLENGTLDMVVLVGKWIEGLDVPCVSCIVLMCITASIQKFRQMVGRAFRPHPGKDGMIIVDHFGNAGRVVDGHFVPKHGLPDWHVEWSLEGRKVGRGGPKPDEPKPLCVCGECFVTYEPASFCPNGHATPVQARKPPKKLKGRLTALTPEQMEQKGADKHAAKLRKEQEAANKALQREHDRKQEWSAQSFEDLLRIARDRGYNPNWARIRWGILEPKLRAKAEREAARLLRRVIG